MVSTGRSGTYRCQGASVDDKYKSARTGSIVVPHEVRRGSVHALQRVRALRLRHDVEADTFFPEDTAFREELFDSSVHLRIDIALSVDTATNDDDVVLAANQVRAVPNS